MGLWDNIKKTAIKAKCTIGIHGGKYEVIQGETCKYSKLCPDCKKTIETEKHDFEDEKYKFENECVVSSKCHLCGLENTRVRHEDYVEVAIDDFCNIKEQCVRCKDERINGKKHNWIKSGENETHKLYICTVCADKKEEQKINFKS